MANNLPTFDVDTWRDNMVCCWPGCEETALMWVVRKHDKEKFCHCSIHHFMIVYKPQVINQDTSLPDTTAHGQVDAAAVWERINKE